jgi:microcystin-dependent protein
MEGTIGEVRIFGGNFAPSAWRYCDGSLLPISEYTALYSVLGTAYGGDGVQTFAVPDLRSRIPVGTGQGAGLSAYVIGEVTGSENITLLPAQMAAHTHASVSAGGGGTVTATGTLMASATAGGDASPAGKVLGIDTSITASIYGADTGTLVPMASNAITLNNLSPGKLPVVALSAAGNTMPHSNLQPCLAVNFIICLEGIFPSRN